MVVTKPEASDSPLIADKLTEGKGVRLESRVISDFFGGKGNNVAKCDVTSVVLSDQRQRAEMHRDTSGRKRVVHTRRGSSMPTSPLNSGRVYSS